MTPSDHDQSEGKDEAGSQGTAQAQAETSAAAKTAAPGKGEAPRALPEIDFPTFVLSLGTSVLINLGELAAPNGGIELDLPLAKQTIDLIGMLEEKTRGNLTEGESRLLSSLLYDLRVKYIDALKQR